jgi:hypothetical protein
MRTEYIVWGHAPQKDYEEILHTKSKTKQQAETVCRILEDKHGCTNTRIQILDFNDTENLFIKSLNL